MFEGFVYQLIAGYLGHYVKDIQREQLRIGLWSGELFTECLLIACGEETFSPGLRNFLRLTCNALGTNV